MSSFYDTTSPSRGDNATNTGNIISVLETAKATITGSKAFQEKYEPRPTSTVAPGDTISYYTELTLETGKAEPKVSKVRSIRKDSTSVNLHDGTVLTDWASLKIISKLNQSDFEAETKYNHLEEYELIPGKDGTKISENQ